MTKKTGNHALEKGIFPVLLFYISFTTRKYYIYKIIFVKYLNTNIKNVNICFLFLLICYMQKAKKQLWDSFQDDINELSAPLQELLTK
ncbi:TPA: hypothetical protein DEP21_03160 [Patescibacteria group bacterium]|nr:hypothetical protein [Candidatus Gracilibacteria bacterium]